MYGAMNDRLTKSDWIAHGLRTLASSGAGALKVGSMADALRVSRGSFYWHFDDVGDFKRQLLEGWRERATERVIQELEKGADRSNPLRHLLHRAFSQKHGLDRAVRLWAADENAVAAVVASVDARRVDFITELLVASGAKPSEAPGRAKFIYWAYLGRSIATGGHEAIDVATLDGISALLEM